MEHAGLISNFFVPIPLAQIGSSSESERSDLGQEILFWSGDGAHSGCIDMKYERPHAPAFQHNIFSPTPLSPGSEPQQRHNQQPQQPPTNNEPSFTVTLKASASCQERAYRKPSSSMIYPRQPALLDGAAAAAAGGARHPSTSQSAEAPASLLCYSRSLDGLPPPSGKTRASGKAPSKTRSKTKMFKPRQFSLLSRRVPALPLDKITSITSLTVETWESGTSSTSSSNNNSNAAGVPFGATTPRPTPRLAKSDAARLEAGPSVSDTALQLSAYLKRQTTMRFEKTSAFVRNVEDDAATRIQLAWRLRQVRVRWLKFPHMLRTVVDFQASERRTLRELNELQELASPLRSLDPKGAGKEFGKLFGFLPTLVKLFSHHVATLCSGEYSLSLFHRCARFLKDEVLPLLFVYSKMIPEIVLSYSQLVSRTRSKSKEAERARLNYLLMSPVNHLFHYQQQFTALLSFEQTRSFDSCLRAINTFNTTT